MFSSISDAVSSNVKLCNQQYINSRLCCTVILEFLNHVLIAAEIVFLHLKPSKYTEYFDSISFT